GKFEGTEFEPEDWRPRTPIPALRHARPDDNLWAALRVMAFTDDQIRAVVREGRYGNEEAEEWMGNVLIERRDKIGRTYLTRINPLVAFSLDASGTLRFENAATKAGFASPPARGYRADWYRFDNATGMSQALGQATSEEGEGIRAPAALPGDATFIRVAVSAVEPPHPSWTVPVDAYFRRSPEGWKLVGLERLPSPP
ncbi:MAG TPA: hypothetical protein VJ921_03960, partial [Vicinamibacteria bacterium]|nr:hypothetical protein [Vicinamibacteria bacterium]